MKESTSLKLLKPFQKKDWHSTNYMIPYLHTPFLYFLYKICLLDHRQLIEENLNSLQMNPSPLNQQPSPKPICYFWLFTPKQYFSLFFDSKECC